MSLTLRTRLHKLPACGWSMQFLVIEFTTGRAAEIVTTVHVAACSGPTGRSTPSAERIVFAALATGLYGKGR